MKLGTFELGKALKLVLPFVGVERLAYVFVERDGALLRVLASNNVQLAVADVTVNEDDPGLPDGTVAWKTLSLFPNDVRALLAFLGARADDLINMRLPPLQADNVARVSFWNTRNALTLELPDQAPPNWRKAVETAMPGRFLPADIGQLGDAFKAIGGQGHLLVGDGDGQPIVARGQGARILVMPLAGHPRNAAPETVL